MSEPIPSFKDLTEFFIEFRNMLSRLSQLPSKDDRIRLHTRERAYIGQIKSINVAERRVVLAMENGIMLIVPFHALMMPEKPNSK